MLEIGLGESFRFLFSVTNRSFNPCFVGNRSGSCFVPTFMFCGMMVSILVLLEIGLGEAKLPAKTLSHFCFNPCFVGNRSGSGSEFVHQVPVVQFQSLFCWKSVWEP